MQRIGLYYPYIHCRDERWLKTAALYWPRLARVVPQDYPVADSDTVKELHDGLGLMTRVTPTATAEAIAPYFLQALREHEADLGRYRLEPAMRRSVVSVNAEPQARWEQFHDHGNLSRHQLAGFHEDEVAPQLRDALIDSDLAVSTQRSSISGQSDARWLAMRPDLAWIYKCVFTQVLARSTRYTPVTDQHASHGVFTESDWNSERVARLLLGEDDAPAEKPDLADAIGMMSVRLVIPQNIDAVPVKKIVELRRRHKAEFDRFTQAVDSAAADFRDALGDVEDPEALRQHLSLKVSGSIEIPLELLRRAMRGLKVNTTFSALGAKFGLGTMATVALSALPAGIPLVTAGATMVFGVAALRRNAAQTRDTHMNTSPTAYLLRLEKELHPQELHRRVLDGIGRVTGTTV
ncbi:DUF6236 family protein [Streptomyces demainii]|uniref:Uncharacterized protein n=1 Tax=Streptomyces demainii TaxID=588122 RepID=A0ABT9KZU2_9ACTN|nr:DUF6236 family protein [Streptomyces demainii]MDP9612846.1 hypothetical protein [Streptomyces demainii]